MDWGLKWLCSYKVGLWTYKVAAKRWCSKDRWWGHRVWLEFRENSKPQCLKPNPQWLPDTVFVWLTYDYIIIISICHQAILWTIQFGCSVVSDSLQPHESRHTRPPCPSPTPGVHSDSRLSSQWCHPAISSSVIPFSSCPQSLPASVFSNESTLHMRWPKYWSFSFASFLPKYTQDWSSLGWTGWISLQSKGLSRVFTHKSKTCEKSKRFYTYIEKIAQFQCVVGKMMVATNIHACSTIQNLRL